MVATSLLDGLYIFQDLKWVFIGDIKVFKKLFLLENVRLITEYEIAIC